MNDGKMRMTVTELAKRLGVAPKTIVRWEKGSKIPKAKRDWRGWRVYFQSDLQAIRRFHDTLTE